MEALTELVQEQGVADIIMNHKEDLENYLSEFPIIFSFSKRNEGKHNNGFLFKLNLIIQQYKNIDFHCEYMDYVGYERTQLTLNRNSITKDIITDTSLNSNHFKVFIRGEDKYRLQFVEEMIKIFDAELKLEMYRNNDNTYVKEWLLNIDDY